MYEDDEELKNQEQPGMVKQAAKEVEKIAVNKAKKTLWDLIKPHLPAILSAIGWFFLILLAVGVIVLIPYLIWQFITSLFTSASAAGNPSGVASAETANVVYLGDNGEYKISVEDLADQILGELENNKVDNEAAGFSSDDLDNMIDKYIKAEIQTTYPKTGASGNDFDGIIKIYRASTNAEDGETKELKYMEYDKFKDYTEDDFLDYFSLEPETFKLCIAREGDSVTYKDKDGNSISGIEGARSEGIVKELIEYKTAVQNYSVPLNFFISLHMMSQDVDFMKDFVDKVLGSDKTEPIILTYVESKSTTITKKEYTGTKTINKISTTRNNETNMPISNPVRIIEGPVDIDEDEVLNYYYPDYFQEVRIETTGSLQVTKADTWLKTVEKTITDNNSTNEDEWNIVSENSLDTIVRNLGEDEIVNEEDNTTTHTTKVATINATETTKVNSVYKGYTIVDSQNKINVDEFAEWLVNDYPRVANNLSTAPSTLFYLLQQDESTQQLEKIMRYVIYKLTGIDYGYTEDNIESILNELFTEYTGISNLASYLRQFSHSNEAPKSVDGNYYLMYGDGEGWPTIGDADLQWKSHHGKFNISGKVLENGTEKEVPSIEEYVKGYLGSHDAEFTDSEIDQMQIYVEKKKVDEVGSQVQQKFFKDVEKAIEGLNLSRQQKYALVTINYNFGSLPVRNGKTFKQTYQAGLDLYEENSWEHNMYIWDNWWCALGGGSPGHIPARDAAFETYVKGVFNFSQSEAGKVFERKYYIYYTAEQLAKFDYAPKKSITRTTQSENEIFKQEQSSGTFEADSSDSRVNGYYISSSGRRFTVLNQLKINDWDDKCNRASAATIASGYSEESADELISKINSSKSKDGWSVVPNNKYFEKYGLKIDSTISDYKKVSEYPELIRNQLNLGGYVMVWINKNDNGGEYYGKSGTRWTRKYHWVPILDYKVEDGKEKILIADWRGADWYSIEEFQYGLSEIVLISER